ncbi:MAG: tryptophan synthase subunit alpha [Pseudomonadota bacterium]|nr:tryptophan synthase subunit alpha [Pseudomonadota bacterium]
MSRYARMFQRLEASGDGALGAFLMLGDPDLETSAALLAAAVEGGADMLEVGIPFSDPVADGPVIQAAAGRALESGVRVADCFALIDQVRQRFAEIPIGILTYANLVMAPGRSEFFRRAAAAGTDSLLIADLPAFEAAPWAEEMREVALEPVLIAATNTPQPTLERIAGIGGAYTYCVTRAGVTGAGGQAAFDSNLIERLRSAGAPPPVFGFGISCADQVSAAIAAGAAGAISGSAIVQAAARAGEDAVRTLVVDLKAGTRRG